MIKFLNFIFHSSVLFLIIISLYPGSLVGYLLYGDFGTQPNLISNPYGTSINHFIFYFYVSGLGLCLYSKKTNFYVPWKMIVPICPKPLDRNYEVSDSP